MNTTPSGEDENASRGSRFPETLWTRVRRAHNPGDPDAARKAFGQLCGEYWSPLYRTGLQAANLLDDTIPAVASLNDGEEYQRWVTQLSSDLKSLRFAFWDRALEVQPDAGPMFQQLGIKKPAH